MNHPVDYLKKISDFTKESDSDKVKKINYEMFSRTVDKGWVLDQTAGDFDTSSTIPVASNGFPSSQEETNNFFMIVRVSDWQVYYNNYQLDTSSIFYVPSPSSLTYLTTTQMGNFLTWAPDGVAFPSGVEINESGAIPA